MRATTPSSDADFTVKIVFKASSTLFIEVQNVKSDSILVVVAPKTTSLTDIDFSTEVTSTSEVSSDTNVSLATDSADQLERVTCNDDGVCVDPINSRFTCQFDEAANKMVCGIDLVK